MFTAASTRVEAMITLGDDATARQAITVLSNGILASTDSLESALAANGVATNVIAAPATSLQSAMISTQPPVSPQSPAVTVTDLMPSSDSSLTTEQQSGMTTTVVIIAVAAFAVLLVLTLSISYVRRQKRKMTVPTVDLNSHRKMRKAAPLGQVDLNIHSTFSATEDVDDDIHEVQLQQEIELIQSLHAARMESIDGGTPSSISRMAEEAEAIIPKASEEEEAAEAMKQAKAEAKAAAEAKKKAAAAAAKQAKAEAKAAAEATSDAVMESPPPHRTLVATFGPGPFGMSLKSDSRTLVTTIGTVDDGSQAMEQGVRPGSVILEVAGALVQGLEYAEVKRLVVGAERPLSLLLAMPAGDADVV